MSEAHINTTAWWERYRNDVDAGEPHYVEVFFRSLAPSQGSHDKRRRILRGLEQAAEDSLLDSYDINVVGEGVCLCDDCGETRIARHMHETLRTLREGGDDAIEPTGFAERTVDSELTNEHYTLLVPPKVTLGVYVDGSLRGVFPATVEGIPVSVTDFLNALATLTTLPAAPQAEA